jgi:hypothetical protein
VLLVEATIPIFAKGAEICSGVCHSHLDLNTFVDSSDTAGVVRPSSSLTLPQLARLEAGLSDPTSESNGNVVSFDLLPKRHGVGGRWDG